MFVFDDDDAWISHSPDLQQPAIIFQRNIWEKCRFFDFGFDFQRKFDGLLVGGEFVLGEGLEGLRVGLA